MVRRCYRGKSASNIEEEILNSKLQRSHSILVQMCKALKDTCVHDESLKKLIVQQLTVVSEYLDTTKLKYRHEGFLYGDAEAGKYRVDMALANVKLVELDSKEVARKDAICHIEAAIEQLKYYGKN